MLHITTYILIGPLIRVIQTYITSYTILPILIFTLKTNNLGDMPRYTLNPSLNSRLRQILSKSRNTSHRHARYLYRLYRNLYVKHRIYMQSFDYISEKLEVSPTLDPFLGMCSSVRISVYQ